jgi:gluconokinase
MTEPAPINDVIAIIIMGVSGCGKSTVAGLIARELGLPFRDGDSFHPEANVAKMQAGVPLTDEDRWPWLAAMAAWIDKHRQHGETVVLACSALKRVYRDALRAGHADVRFVFLKGTKEEIAGRLAARKGHYMPPSLLDSQLATLEPPGVDERPVTVSIMAPPEAIAAQALAHLREAAVG